MSVIMKSWIDEAVCAGQTDLFFAPAGERAGRRAIREAAALAVCAVCPVRAQCADAGADEVDGIWGGEIKTPV